MYKIMIHIDTHTNDTWFYYQEEGKDYVANSLEEIKETVLTLIDVYGEDYIKIVKQETGDDMNGSVETFLYDSTDNYEELVNRPFINGVEIVGELSLVELGIQPVGNYATSERVDALEETVNNIDFSPYATNARVDQVEYKVDNIDLTPYATNERVDQVEAKVDAIDLEPYATMDYLDEVVAGIDFSASNENITGVKTFSVLPRSTVMPVTEDELTNKSYVDHEVLGCATEEYVDNAIANIPEPLDPIQFDDDKGLKRYYLTGTPRFDTLLSETISVTTTLGASVLEKAQQAYDEMEIGEKAIFIMTHPTYGLFKSYVTKVSETSMTATKAYVVYDMMLYSFGIMSLVVNNGVVSIPSTVYYSATALKTGLANSKNYLSKTNTSSFTPTGDYHPATKKYVDDLVSNIGTYVPLSANTDMRNLPTGTYGNVSDEVLELTIAERGETLGFLTPGELCWWINQTDNDNRTLVIPRGSMDPNYEFGSQLELAIYYASDDEGFQGALCSGDIMTTGMDYYITGRYEYQTLPVTETIPMEDNEFVNKRYVDKMIMGNAPTYVIHKASSTPWYPNGDYPNNSYNTSNGPEVQAIIQEVYDAGYDAFNIIMFDSGYAYFFQHSLGLVQNKPTSITLEAHHMGTNGVEMPAITDMNIRLQWNDNVAAVSNVSVQSKKLVSRLDTQYLNKTNTTSFTPSADYHPATKKYVDDSIAAIDGTEDIKSYVDEAIATAIGGALEGGY